MECAGMIWRLSPPHKKKKQCKRLEVFSSTLTDHHGTYPAYVLKFQNNSHFLPSLHHFPIPTIYQSTASICKGSPSFLSSTSIRCCISSISALLACCSRIRRSSAKPCSRFCMRSWRRCNAAICWELVSASKGQSDQLSVGQNTLNHHAHFGFILKII